ncbi:S8 family serine peptidase [uncultured Anaerococcus sp.]|uniref:S8 family serine peptidase n=1 Tax=uncultured Anaerococcus sp. TaxID=293428 RepID=UPI0028893BC6|nr:S8 family serine peptidase [uncultured Anaerococcus sp.]
MGKHKSKVMSLVLAFVLILSNIMPVYADSSVGKTNIEKTKAVDLSKKNPSLAKGLEEVNNKNLLEFYNKVGKDNKVRVAVELNDQPILDRAISSGRSIKEMSTREIKSMSDKLEAKQADVKNIIHKNNIETFDNDGKEVSANFSFTTIFNGFSTYVKANDIEKLTKIKEVKNVYLVNEYNKPKDVVDMTSSNGMIGAPQSWNLGYKGEGMLVAVLDSGFDIAHKDFNITDKSKVILDEKETDRLVGTFGLKGKYYTPKFPYAYNYYDNSDKIKSETSNHGQHVAGTIAANGQIKGVAPEAQLLGMKVFSDDPLYSTTFSDVYAKAIDDSIKLGADAINMSLGSTAGSYYYGSLEDKALDKAKEAGILVTISAGNEHTFVDGAANFRDIISGGIPYPFAKNPDTGVLGSPSIYNGDISIASVNNVKFQKRVMEYTIGDEKFQAQISPASGAPNPWEVFKDQIDGSDVVYINKDNKGEGSKAPGDKASVANNDVAGKIVLVERGNTFTDTIVNVQEAGAKALIVYNNERKDAEDLINMAGGDLAKIPMLMIGRSHGVKIIENLDKVKLHFPADLIAFDNPKGKLLSDFSSWGTTPELQLKPELSTPGGNIYSTDNNDSYVDMSGTSMAAPHAAGGSALVSQRIYRDKDLFGNLSKKEVGKLTKILLMNTAKPYTNEYGDFYLVRQQGAGLMDLESALSTDTYVVNKKTDEAKVELGSFDSNKITMDFVIYNKSKKTRKFEVSANALTDARQKVENYEYSLEASKVLENIDVDAAKNVLVPARGKKEVRVTIDLSKAIEKGELTENSFVEGFVSFKSLDKKSDLSVPYLGFYGDWESLNVLDQPYANLLDNDPTNDPYFKATRLCYVADGKIKYPTPTMTPAYINPNSADGSNAGVILQFSPLRNYDRIEFSIVDENGKVLENLGTTEGGRKVTGMGQGDDPIKLAQEGYWDGKINGKPLEVGRRVFYTAKAYFKKNSKPQVLKFEVMADNDLPQIKDFEGNWKSPKQEGDNDPYYEKTQGLDAKLAYDKDKKQVTFEARDGISGINSVLIANPDTLKSDKPQIKVWKGKDLDKIREVVDEATNTYKYTIDVPSEGFDSPFLAVQIADKAENILTSMVERNDLDSKKADDTRLAYSLNNKTVIARINLPVGTSKMIFSDDFSIFSSLDDSDDKNGYVDFILGKQLKVGAKLAIFGGSSAPQEVIDVKDDTTKPLSPIVDPILKDNVSKITGIAYEADMDIIASLDGNEIAKGQSGEDGKFELTFANPVSDISKVEIHAVRKANATESDKVKLEKTELKAPEVDGDTIGDSQDEIKGNAFLPLVKVVFEKEEDGARKEIESITSEINGRFKLRNFSAERMGLKAGDKLYIYTLVDGVKSAETVKEITEDVDEEEKVDTPSGDLTMFITKPGLLEGYNGEVPFNITMFGWENLDRVTFGTYNLDFETEDAYQVVHPKNKSKLFYGKTFMVEQELDLPEGYYDLPITAHDDKNNKSFSLTRRFWVDKTKPELDLVSEYRQEEKEVDGVKEYTLYTNDDNVNINLSYKDNSPTAALFRGLVKLNTADVTGATGFAFEKSEGSYNEIVHLDKDVNEAEYEYRVADVANNITSVKVKIVREKKEAKKDETNKKPTIEASNINAYVGDEVNLLSGVKATNAKGEDISDRLVSDPKTIDTSKPGTYKVKYSVTDTDGNYADLTVDVKVLARTNDLVDKEELVKAIAKAEAIDESKYSKASFKRLKEALKKGQVLVKSISLTEKEAKEGADNINKALAGLVDISKLSQNAEFAKDILENEEGSYTEESFANLKKAYEEAKALLAKDDPTKREVLRANAKLTKAIKALVEKEDDKANFDELKEVYEKVSKEFEALDRSKYTEESISNLEKALGEAKTVLEDTKASQEDVDNAKSNILKAYEGLVEVEKEEVNKDALRLLYDQVKDKDLSKFTPASKANFLKALEEARLALESEEISQEDVEKARVALDEANRALEEIKVNKAGLEALVKAYENVEEASYTEESYKIFREAYAKAKAVLEDEKASQEDVNKALDALENAHKGLVEKIQINKDSLKATIEEAKKAIAEKQMTEKGSKELKEAIDKAEKVLADDKVDQEAVNEATTALRASLDKVLKEETDLWKVLEELANKAADLAKDPTKTSQSRRLVNNRVRYARTLLKRKTANDKKVQAQIDALKDAIKRLK